MILRTYVAYKKHGIFEVSSVQFTMTEEVKIFANKKNALFSTKRRKGGFTRVALVLIFEMGLYVSIEGDTYSLY